MSESPINKSVQALGLRLQAARELADRKPADCATRLGISPKRYREFEAGMSEPDLPMLEQLAGYLQVPVPVLLGTHAAATSNISPDVQMGLRARVIGAQLRQARVARDLGIDEVAEGLSVPAAQLLAIELAEQPLPVSLLLRFAAFYKSDALTLVSPPERDVAQRARDAFEKLPLDVRTAMQDPEMLPHLRAGLNLRGLNRKDLRRAAKSLQKLAGVLPK